jgi:hypothetical protein
MKTFGPQKGQINSKESVWLGFPSGGSAALQLWPYTSGAGVERYPQNNE